MKNLVPPFFVIFMSSRAIFISYIIFWLIPISNISLCSKFNIVNDNAKISVKLHFFIFYFFFYFYLFIFFFWGGGVDYY